MIYARVTGLDARLNRIENALNALFKYAPMTAVPSQMQESARLVWLAWD
jgi:hypothetical protein